MFVLQDADAALRAGKLNEAAAQCEKYVSAAGGLGQDSSCEMVIRRLAFLYGRLGRLSEAAREYERLAKHYLDMTPPELKKAHAVQEAARRLQIREGISPTA
jgi:hypothetical protein